MSRQSPPSTLSQRKLEGRRSPKNIHQYIPALISLAVHTVLPFFAMLFLGISPPLASDPVLFGPIRPVYLSWIVPSLCNIVAISLQKDRYRLLTPDVAFCAACCLVYLTTTVHAAALVSHVDPPSIPDMTIVLVVMGYLAGTSIVYFPEASDIVWIMLDRQKNQ